MNRPENGWISLLSARQPTTRLVEKRHGRIQWMDQAGGVRARMCAPRYLARGLGPEFRACRKHVVHSIAQPLCGGTGVSR